MVIIFYLVTIILSLNCMEEGFVIIEEQDESIQVLNKLIGNGDEQKIIKFLDEHILPAQKISSILNALSDAKLDKAFDHLLKNEAWIIPITDLNKLVNQAIEANNIERLKLLTDFDNYVYDDILCAKDYSEKLDKLKLDSYLIFNKICLYNKINYKDPLGNRYLQTLIEEDYDSTEIMEFIKSANLKELNAQDRDGNTPLHLAVKRWQFYRDNKPENFEGNMLKLESIIKELCNNKANLIISNNENEKPILLPFFIENRQACEELWNIDYETLLNNLIEPTKENDQPDKSAIEGQPKKSNLTMQIAAGIGFTIIGIAAFYFCYKFLNQNQLNNQFELN